MKRDTSTEAEYSTMAPYMRVCTAYNQCVCARRSRSGSGDPVRDEA